MIIVIISFTEVLREGVVIIHSNSYTPVPEDRQGITIKCTDTVNTKWRVPADAVKSLFILPYSKFIVITFDCH